MPLSCSASVRGVLFASSNKTHPSSNWWLRMMASSLAATDPNYWPPRNKEFAYDWSLPTYQVYREEAVASTTDETHRFTPAFAPARSRLDYHYHSNLVRHRQLLQDEIMGQVVNATERKEVEAPDKLPNEDKNEKLKDVENNNARNLPKDSSPLSRKKRRPWIVYTAGAMGVGKGYVLTQLQQNNLFPVTDFVKIDPDLLKSQLPEMAGYLQSDRDSAATKLHRESTQIADVLFEHALSHQLDVLVDGSLRNLGHYQNLFRRIHRDFPDYRIAIIHVTADANVIVERAAARAEKTGRVVPRDLLQESIRQVPRSVSILSELADATIVIANNENKRPLELVSLLVQDHQDHYTENNDSNSNSGLLKKMSGNSSSWKEFARLWKENGDAAKGDDDDDETKPGDDVVSMSSVFDCPESHSAANKIWLKAYPNFCARCALACDGQCGVCIHEQHLCACKICTHNNNKNNNS